MQTTEINRQLKVAGKSRQSQKGRVNGSELFVTTPGHFIGKRDERIIVRMNQKIVAEVPAIKLTGVSFGVKGISLSGDVIAFCMDKGIYIHLVDGTGNIAAVIRPPGGESGQTSLLQIVERNTEKGLSLAKMFVLGKVNNQFALLKYYYKYSANRANGFGKAFNEKLPLMKHLFAEIKGIGSYECPDNFRHRLMGLEGAFAVHYWAIIRHLFSNGMSFEGRKKHGAKDIINSSLNYGYGVLYSHVLNALIKAGLNPAAGFLHSFHDNQPVLAYDVIEEFRAMVVDRAVFTLFRRGEKIIQEEDGLLAPESRKKIALAVTERLSGKTSFAGKRTTTGEIIMDQALNIKRHLAGASPYRPFLSRW